MERFRFAEPADADAVVGVVNAAFRPAESFFIESDRLSVPEFHDSLRTGRFLVAEDGGPGLAGSVYIELRGERAYFGILAVDPSRQRSGLARRLIAAVEDHARANGCRFMDLTVVNLRSELPAYYGRMGYVMDGTQPFPEGVPTKVPVHLFTMSKAL